MAKPRKNNESAILFVLGGIVVLIGMILRAAVGYEIWEHVIRPQFGLSIILTFVAANIVGLCAREVRACPALVIGVECAIFAGSVGVAWQHGLADGSSGHGIMQLALLAACQVFEIGLSHYRQRLVNTVGVQIQDTIRALGRSLLLLSSRR